MQFSHLFIYYATEWADDIQRVDRCAPQRPWHDVADVVLAAIDALDSVYTCVLSEDAGEDSSPSDKITHPLTLMMIVAYGSFSLQSFQKTLLFF